MTAPVPAPAPTRLWTPTFIGLSVANFCNSMIFYLLVPMMATHARDAFGAGPAAGGTLASIFFIGALAARFVSGGLLERFGARGLATGAAAFYLVTTAAYLVAPTYGATLAVRLANGVGFGLLGSALVSGVMLTIPASRRGEGAGWFGVGISLGIGVGPFLALTLGQGPGGMRAVFVAATACALLALALILTAGRGLPGRPAAQATGEATSAGIPSWRRLLDRRAVGIGTVVLLGGFAYSAVLAFLDPATEGTPLESAAGLFFLVYSLVVLVSRPAAGLLQDRLGERRVLLPAAALFAVGMALVSVLGPGWVLLAGAAVLGLGWGTMTTGGQAAAVSRVPRERTGAAVATYFFLLDLGTGLGPIVLGLLVPAVGYRGAFVVATAVAVATAVVYAVDSLRARRGQSPARRGG